jgi:predicted dienelactone hydrolase
MVHRARDIGLVTDYMLAGWKDHGRIALTRLGLFGFSAGATTALITLGGVPDLDLVTSHCRTAPEFVCKLQPAGTTLTNPNPALWRHDPRFKAAVIAAPGLGFAFAPQGLSKVTAAVQLWAGAADDRVPYATNAGLVRQLLPQAPDFHSVAGAGHLAFLAPCGLVGPPAVCKDTPGFDRAAFHADFNRQVVGFFTAQLSPP